jgi:endonuclease YncB( thermonuclease family)
VEVPAPGQGRRRAALYHRHYLQLPEVVRRFALAVICSAFAANCIAAEAWTGKVVGVKDGDTLEIMNGRTAVVVRLHGIDCPEHGQPFGREARRAASELAFGKTVTVLPRNRDRYGRTVASVTLPGHSDLAHTLLARGLAWWYRKYAPRDANLRLLEENARDRRLGLWSDLAPIPPWSWR